MTRALAILSAAFLSACAGSPKAIVTSAPAKYDTKKLHTSIESGRQKIKTATQHVIIAGTKVDTALANAKEIEAKGTEAHSPQAQLVVDQIEKAKQEIDAINLSLTQAENDVSDAKGEAKAADENRNSIAEHDRQVTEQAKGIIKQAQADHDGMVRAKNSRWWFLALGFALAVGAYVALKFVFRVPFIIILLWLNLHPLPQLLPPRSPPVFWRSGIT